MSSSSPAAAPPSPSLRRPESTRRSFQTCWSWLALEEQLLVAGARRVDVDRRVDAALGELAVEPQLHVAGALELLEDHLVHLEPVSTSAVARMVSEPPSSTLRAAPKNFLGG